MSGGIGIAAFLAKTETGALLATKQIRSGGPITRVARQPALVI